MAGINFSAQVRGFAELDRALSELPKDLAKTALNRAVRAGASALLRAARAAAPVRATPELKLIRPRTTRAGRRVQRQIARRLGRAGGGTVTLTKREVRILQRDAGGARRGPGFLKRAIKIYSVRLIDGQMTGRIGIGQAFYGGFREFGTRHQGARPWFASAVQNASAAAVEALRARLRRELDLAAAKYAARGR